MKLTEQELHFDHYKQHTETELLTLRERLRIAEENKVTEDYLRREIFELKFTLSTKDEEISKL